MVEFETSKYEQFCKKLETVLQITSITRINKGETLDTIEDQLDEFIDKIAEQNEEEEQKT